MIRKMLKLPQGIAGVLALGFAILVGVNFDPANFPQKDAMYAKTTQEAVAIYHLNEKNKKEKDMALLMIFVPFGFGVLMLINAAWTASRQEDDQNRQTDHDTTHQSE